MSTFKVYSPKKVKVHFATDLPIQGFAEGTSIQAARSADNSTQAVGMQGDVGLTANANKTGTITFTLMQNSETNATLSHIQNAQDLSDTLLRGGITVTDPSGSYLVHAKGCHIMTPAEMSLGDDQESKVWVFFCEELHFLSAGSLIKDASVVSRADKIVNTLKGISSL